MDFNIEDECHNFSSARIALRMTCYIDVSGYRRINLNTVTYVRVCRLIVSLLLAAHARAFHTTRALLLRLNVALVNEQ